jgi:hypothetical protein
MLDGMKMARDSLAEYYRDDAPVMVMIDASIAEAEEYSRAYELLFKEHGGLRLLCRQLYEAERDKNQQDWTAVIRELEKIGADNTATDGHCTLGKDLCNCGGDVPATMGSAWCRNRLLRGWK